MVMINEKEDKHCFQFFKVSLFHNLKTIVVIKKEFCPF